MCSRYRLAKFAPDFGSPPVDQWEHVAVSVPLGEERYPSMDVPVVAIGRSRRPTAVAMRWGFKDADLGKQYLTKIESIRSRYWLGWKRALVPVMSFVEYDWQGHAWSFSGKLWEPLWLASLWQMRTDGLTTTLFTKPAEKPVKDAHSRMACPLTWEEGMEFLNGGHPHQEGKHRSTCEGCPW